MNRDRSQKMADYGTARYAVMGALDTIERLTRPDGIPLGDHVARQAARLLRSAADLLDQPEVTFKHVEFAGSVSTEQAAVLQRRYAESAARARVGEPYPACCDPEGAEGRLLEQEADTLHTERQNTEGI